MHENEREKKITNGRIGIRNFLSHCLCCVTKIWSFQKRNLKKNYQNQCSVTRSAEVRVRNH